MLWDKHNLIYAAKEINELWTRDGIAGSRYAVSDKGYLKMPGGQRIRTHKWSNHLLCLVGGRWGMTLISALISMLVWALSCQHKQTCKSVKDCDNST